MSGLTSSWHCMMASWSALLTAALTEVNLLLERRLYRGAGVYLSSLFGKLWEGGHAVVIAIAITITRNVS